ncbi:MULTISPECIES: FAD/NAD(P)-binding protein [Streptomyces]|uniref:FAD/NAD(P)-binding protein n=1 Tax=Streptomyces TaxID=1883 RepID=UPI00163D0AFE|nr:MULTISPECIES: FAD/NAD(P)-binding protein [Streptomyces]MBC2874405.1 FAD/NAD(P)-binding protein [Streptomyces sp. TYQ1024]UBI40437.1 FAD/NAD(P)-binding protein [Streptomyces mobaraensis]UKW33019.1 FAD/NAD(P)-binding protein [Streptomyces sp. TYQ1024]
MTRRDDVGDGDSGGYGYGYGDSAGRTVAIVGAGAAGTSVFAHLVAALPRAGGRPIGSVLVVDPSPPGWGLAFGDDDPLLMCNSAANINSLLPDRPDDFVTHLRARGWTGAPDTCVPRAAMAAYCADRWADTRDTAERTGVTVRHLPCLALSVGLAGGRPRLRLDDGSEHTADDVILATGVHRPRVPRGFAAFTGHPRYVDSPYPSARLRASLGTGRRRVLALGSRQSAVDAALLLCRDGHRTTLTSPSGSLPAVRLSLHAPPRDFPPLERMARLGPDDPLLDRRLTRCVVEAVRLLGDRPLRAQTSRAADPVRRLAEDTALAEAGVCLWPGVAVAVIEALTAFADGLPADRTLSLMRRFDWFVGRYLTALTVVNARRLLEHCATGALRVAPAYPESVAFADGVWRVSTPGSGPPETYDYVVNATGFRPPEVSWRADGSELLLSPAGTVVDRLEADLRVRRAPDAPPERVWLAGVGTHVRIPFANHLRTVTRQARWVAGQVAARG